MRPQHAVILLLAASFSYAADPATKLTTDQRIAAYSKAVAAQPGSSHLQNLLALSYIQKMRETVDFSYLDRASTLIEGVLTRDPGNYEALRLRSEIDMERHEFARVAEYSEEMTHFAPDDPASWGTLGDASMELGRYDVAGAAYAKMLSLRPDLASYNRMAWYNFVNGRVDQAIATLKSAIAAGSPAAENVAWCWNDLGNIYFKTGRINAAADAYTQALDALPGYYPSYAGLGRVRAAQKRWKDAIEAYRHAQATVPMPEFAAALEDLYALSGNAAGKSQAARPPRSHRPHESRLRRADQSQRRAALRRSRPQSRPCRRTRGERSQSATRRVHLRCARLGSLQAEAFRRRRSRGAESTRSSYARTGVLLSRGHDLRGPRESD